MMRTVVTGAAGFIGSTLVDRLLADGHYVVGIDNLISGRLSNLEQALQSDRFRFIEDSVTSAALAGVVAGTAPEVVFHLAAQVDVRKSVDDPWHDAQTNIMGTINVLEASRRAGVRRIVFAASGGSRYGEPTGLPVKERVPPNPLSPYAAAKAACELYLSAYTGMYDLAPVCLALANVYGPRQDPHGEAGVVAIFGGAMLAGRPTAIYGTGNAARDYVYVGDVVEAFVRAGLAPLTLNGMFNIGTGIQTTTAELHRMMSEIIGVRAEPRFPDARTGEIQAIALDSSAAASAFGWAPKVGIREGIWRTISWMQEAIDSSCPQRPECRALSDESHCRADPRGPARLNPTAARP